MSSTDSGRGDDLARFLRAQDAHDVYGQARAELRRGRKTSHWMWFVFPQLAGLGRSTTARRYAIASHDEALAYLRHPVLGPRLVECAEIVAASSQHRAEAIFGAVDALKLHSSMTLFHDADPDQLAFRAVLDRFFNGRSDAATLDLLGR